MRDIVNHAHIVEVLDVLRSGPVTVTTIKAELHTGWHGVERALRALAAYGLVTGCDGGTWDGTLRRNHAYRLTDRGHQAAQTLLRWSVWTAIFDAEDTWSR